MSQKRLYQQMTKVYKQKYIRILCVQRLLMLFGRKGFSKCLLNLLGMGNTWGRGRSGSFYLLIHIIQPSKTISERRYENTLKSVRKGSVTKRIQAVDQKIMKASEIASSFFKKNLHLIEFFQLRVEVRERKIDVRETYWLVAS